jgi:dihydrofolate reductase
LFHRNAYNLADWPPNTYNVAAVAPAVIRSWEDPPGPGGPSRWRAWLDDPSTPQRPGQPEVSNMRKVVAYELLSLDGVAEDPDGFITEWDDAMDANLAAVIATQDAVILGRRSYNEWADFWPDSKIQPFATFINAVAKYVATSAPLDRDWANTTVVDGGLVEFVRTLKEQPGGDIGVHASISVVQALLAAGVVDELRIVIAPAIAGGGRQLLDGLPPIRLEAIRSTTSPSGYLLVDYQVIR